VLLSTLLALCCAAALVPEAAGCKLALLCMGQVLQPGIQTTHLHVYPINHGTMMHPFASDAPLRFVAHQVLLAISIAGLMPALTACPRTPCLPACLPACQSAALASPLIAAGFGWPALPLGIAPAAEVAAATSLHCTAPHHATLHAAALLLNIHSTGAIRPSG
jgi:hypothetical protein